MNYDDIFNEDISETEEDLIYEGLNEIFNSNGMDKELEKLAIASRKLQNEISSYRKNDSMENYNKFIRTMAIAYTIMEGILISKDMVFDEVSKHKKNYVNYELKKLGVDVPIYNKNYDYEQPSDDFEFEFMKDIDINNRLAKYFKDGYTE